MELLCKRVAQAIRAAHQMADSTKTVERSKAIGLPMKSPPKYLSGLKHTQQLRFKNSIANQGNIKEVSLKYDKQARE